jgi:hypothetical protein
MPRTILDVIIDRIINNQPAKVYIMSEHDDPDPLDNLHPCDDCNGTGIDPEDNEPCQWCQGTGVTNT